MYSGKEIKKLIGAVAVVVIIIIGIIVAVVLNKRDNEEAQEEKSSFEMGVKAEDVVTDLCEYNGVDITLTGTYDVTEEAKTSYLSLILSSYGFGEVEITDRDTVQAGDYVLVDYTGYLDGEAFDRGAAVDTMIDVNYNMDVHTGSTYIDGFSSGLIGAKKGTTVSSDVTFPESYGNADLAGKLTTFEFKIKGIYRPMGKEDLTDEMVAENFGEFQLYTVEDLMNDIDTFLQQNGESTKYSDTVEATKQYMLDHCTVEIPDEYLEARLREYKKSFETDYVTDTQTLEEFLQATYGISEEEAEEEWRTMLLEQIKTEMIFMRVAQKEGLEVDEEEYSMYIDSFLSDQYMGFESTDDVYKYFGAGNIDYGKQYMRDLYLINRAIDFVVENANVTVEEAATE